MSENKTLVNIIMGSDSDLPVMNEAVNILKDFGIGYEVKVLSAHRTPKQTSEYVSGAHQRGVKVIIAGAGGAAHLPGVAAAYTPLPVIGVPVRSKFMDGLDSLLSIVQMPGGVPVATVGVNQAKNAGLLAVQIIASSDEKLLNAFVEYKKRLEKESLDKNKNIL